MANFTLIRALGWAIRSRLLSSEMAQIDADRTRTINADSGSNHTPTTRIQVHGQGMDIAPLVSADLRAHVANGHFLEFDTGSALLIDPGVTATLKSTLLVDHATGGALGIISFSAAALADFLANSSAIFRAAAALDLKSGASLFAENGTNVVFGGHTYVADQAGGGTTGTLYVGDSLLGAGHFVITQYGDGTVQSGGLVTVASGGTVTFTGAAARLNVQSGADVVVDGSGSSIVVQNSASLSTAASTTVTMAGTNNLTGTTVASHLSGVQDGRLQKSGAAGRTGLRTKDADELGSGDVAFDPSQWDIIAIGNGGPGSGGVDSTWTFTNPTATACEVTIVASNGSSVGNVLKFFGKTFLIDGSFGSVTIWSDGGAWTRKTQSGNATADFYS